MIGIVWVAGAVKQAVFLVQSGFQHIEHIPVPRYYLIPVAVFDAAAADTVYLIHLIRPQTKAFLPEQRRCVV